MSKRTAGDDYTTARAVAEAMIGKCGLSQSLGMKIIDAGPKYSVVEMVLEDRHLNGFSIAHGGAVFALADTASQFSSDLTGLMQPPGPHVLG